MAGEDEVGGVEVEVEGGTEADRRNHSRAFKASGSVHRLACPFPHRFLLRRPASPLLTFSTSLNVNE